MLLWLLSVLQRHGVDHVKCISPFIIKYQKNTLPVYVVSWKLMWMNLQNWQNYSMLLKFLQLL